MDNIINDNDMNEIELKTKIEGLEKAIQEYKADASKYEDKLKETQQQLKDYNKPELTPTQMDDIYVAVEKAIEEFDFDDIDNFAMDYGIDYDGRVFCESHDFQNSGDLVELICDKMNKLFKEVPSNEEGEADNS